MSINSKKVPFGQKVAFGIGMLANQMFPAILGIFMVVLVEDLKFSGLMWGMIYLFPRLFDAISDPIMGFVSDNTKSKWGRRRQYVLIGGIIMGIAYIFMWQLFKAVSYTHLTLPTKSILLPYIIQWHISANTFVLALK